MAFIQTVVFFAFIALVIFCASSISNAIIDKLTVRIVEGRKLTALATQTRNKRKTDSKK